MRLRTLFAALSLLAATSTGWAHHSFCAEFTCGSVELTGEISTITRVNPHAYFTLKVQDRAAGKANEFRIQICPPRDLDAKKLTEDRFKVGATVVVRGSPSKVDKAVIGAVSMTFPDGTVADRLDEWNFPGKTSQSRK